MIRRTLLQTLMIAAAVSTLGADDRRGPYHDGRRGGYGAGPGRNAVRAAIRDLNGIFRHARVDRHEGEHFRRALRELDEFERQASRGRFDRSRLDRAIDNMKDLARADQVWPQDRRIIARHVQELRRLRDYGFDSRFDNGPRGYGYRRDD